jgi:predicted nucleotidyltransferase
MKICAIICEYNPFHNGHLYQIEQARALSGADVLLCVMSGNFVQRGEAAVASKYTRAKHAVLAGADAVIELPVPFATSNAELFAKGALHILSQIPEVSTLCFGAENADKQAFLQAASLLINEPADISAQIKALTAQGLSYAKARAQACSGRIKDDILLSPNNILGLEYTKAILSKKLPIDILPIPRVGSGYKQSALCGEFSSATAIREALKTSEDITSAVPPFVMQDLSLFTSVDERLELIEKQALLSRSTVEIASVCDCTEGLENALKKAAKTPQNLVSSLTSARYTSSRIRRIALQNALGISHKEILDFLQSPLYIQPLALRKERKDVLSVLGNANAPLVLRAHDENGLSPTAKTCLEKQRAADTLYALLRGEPLPKKDVFI